MSEGGDKKLPASQRKLKKAREEGNVPRAQEIVDLGTLMALVWVVYDWPAFQSRLQLLMAERLVDLTRAEVHALPDLLFGTLTAAAMAVAPVLLVACGVGLAVAFIDLKGLLFTPSRLGPDLGNISPGKMLKDIFSVKGLIKSGIALIKVALFAVFLIVTLPMALSVLSHLQVCGLKCLPEAANRILGTLVLFFAAITVLSMIVDIIISRRTYEKEMRMTHQEFVNDQKEAYGNPEIRRRQRQHGRETAASSGALDFSKSTLLIASANCAVALRYDRRELPVPLVVEVARDAAAEAVIENARALKIPIGLNPSLAQKLARVGRRGQQVPAETFREIAAEIVRRKIKV